MVTKTLKTVIRDLEKLANETTNEELADKLYNAIDKLESELYKGVSI